MAVADARAAMGSFQLIGTVSSFDAAPNGSLERGHFHIRLQGSIQGFAIAMPVAAKSSTLRVASSAPWLRQIAAI